MKNNITEIEPLLKIREVARRLSISNTLVYQLIDHGELGHYCVGHGKSGKRVSVEQLAEYMEACKK